MRREGLLTAAALLLLPACVPTLVPQRGYEPAPRARPTPTPTPSPRASRTPRPSLELSPETLSDQPPAWEMRPVTPDARVVPAGSYVVRNGDSLRLISVKTGAGSEAIARANGLTAPYTIQPGQRLIIPAGR
ncbi:MAG: LysM peptidoglycan-binding domain-containing protein, partial [Sphingomonas sp.]